jgi:uncharacterized repeat protein (TIGR03803 family)
LTKAIRKVNVQLWREEIMKQLLCSISSIVVLLYAGCPAVAATEFVVHNFSRGSLVIGQPMGDPSDRLFGTAYGGGGYRDGFVYELTQGTWQYKRIFSFYGGDGANPYAGLTIDRTTGILYGTTRYGGAANAGTVFSLQYGNTGWSHTILHDFRVGEGVGPSFLLTRDPATGVLYGTTSYGGPSRCGTAYQIDPQGHFQILYNFLGGNDGCSPQAQLREGTKSGLLFGSTSSRGQYNFGTLFLLTERSGAWSESVLHQFTGGSDGANPGDITDIANDGVSLYGVASGGGAYNQGIAFQLKKSGNKWKYSVIHTFTGGADGSIPVGLHLESATGLLYGTTENGGASGNGVVFKLAWNGQSWTESVLHSFGGMRDGAHPLTRPYLNPRTGQLFGTTNAGGTYDRGTVYVVTP